MVQGRGRQASGQTSGQTSRQTSRQRQADRQADTGRPAVRLAGKDIAMI